MRNPMSGMNFVSEQPTETVALKITDLGPVAPLDSQFGIYPRKTCPPEIQAAFTQPIEGVGEPPVYALIDVSRAFGLDEDLEASGLEYRPLFTGEAEDSLEEVAPWLVKLDLENSFTRRLLTQLDSEDQTGAYWTAECALFLRSAADMGDIWRHLRKFTRVQDEAGKWYYLRYWESRFFTIYAERIARDPGLVARWFIGTDIEIASIIAVTVDRTKTVLPDLSLIRRMERTPLVVDQRMHDAFAVQARSLTDTDIAESLIASAPLVMAGRGIAAAQELLPFVEAVAEEGPELGVHSRAGFGKLASIDAFFGYRAAHDFRLRHVVSKWLPCSPDRDTLHLRRLSDDLVLWRSRTRWGSVERLQDVLDALRELGHAPDEAETNALIRRVFFPLLQAMPAENTRALYGQMTEQAAAHGLDGDERKGLHHILGFTLGTFFLDDPMESSVLALFVEDDPASLFDDICNDLSGRISRMTLE